MNKRATIAANVLRFLLGWYMFADGLKILMTPGWSSKAFLLSAKTFPAFYAWFATPANLWWVDPLNSWGITLIGAALLLGIAVRPAAWAGAALVILYYFPHYSFPIVPYGWIVEEHLVFASAFVLVALLPQAGSIGFSRLMRNTFLGKIPIIGGWI